MFQDSRQDFPFRPLYPYSRIMADNKHEPQFLGGGPKFNRVGTQPADADSEPASLLPARPAYRTRSIVTIVLVIVLVGLLYWITTGPNGLIHVGGHGGTSPDARPTVPESSSGSPSPP